MPARPCIDCGTIVNGTRCKLCASLRNRARGSSTDRGYDADHERLRAAWQVVIDAGGVLCWRCGKPITGSRWHLGHDDHDRTLYRGPECVGCNCATSPRAKG